jgi:heat shock protein HslJ
VGSQQREPHFILNPQSRRVSGSGGCNRMTGSYELKGDRLSFGRVAGTMMACLEGMDTEKAFLDPLRQVNSWKITGQHLELFDAAGKPVARLEAGHMK